MHLTRRERLLESSESLGGTSTISSNQAVGGAGANGFGGGIYNEGQSIASQNAGSPATLWILGTMITANQAAGGAAGSGGSAGQGVGGGAYFAADGSACLDDATLLALAGNLASTSHNDVIGVFTIC